MTPSRATVAGGKKIEEFYWGGKWIVYVDNRLSEMTYPQAVDAHMTDAERAAEASS